jgi:hypothetical protein
MKKHALVASLSFAMLAACSESAEEETVAEADPLAELAAGTGPYLVANPDGTFTLAYAGTDGSEYTGTMDGNTPATYTVTDGKLCVDPPDSEEEVTPVLCLTMGEVGEDGSWSVSIDGEEGEPATMRRLDAAVTSPSDQVAPGSYLVNTPDEEAPILVVWTDDGLSYVARGTQSGTWRAEGAQRCSSYGDEPETCGAPTSEIGEDGSFTAEDNGNSITVTML